MRQDVLAERVEGNVRFRSGEKLKSPLLNHPAEGSVEKKSPCRICLDPGYLCSDALFQDDADYRGDGFRVLTGLAVGLPMPRTNDPI